METQRAWMEGEIEMRVAQRNGSMGLWQLVRVRDRTCLSPVCKTVSGCLLILILMATFPVWGGLPAWGGLPMEQECGSHLPQVTQEPSAPQSEPYRLGPSDRLTLVGGALVERLQLDGLLEAALYTELGGSTLQIRNLGWSGDDVHGTARAVFGQPSDGFQRLRSDMKLTQPSVVMIAYGANESFSGPEGLEAFRAGLQNVVALVAEAGAKPLLVTPMPFENLGPPLPNMDEANQRLTAYCEVIRELAASQKLPLLDLHRQIQAIHSQVHPLTENGIHLSPRGQAVVSRLLADGMLGRTITDQRWEEIRRSTDLLALIRQKNEWFFHRHRPQNETYLFLFRKHEQGNNAVEIPQFDGLIENVEQEIRIRSRSANKSN